MKALPFEVQMDRMAEMWFTNQTTFDVIRRRRPPRGCATMTQPSSAAKTDFVAEEKVIIS